MKADATTVSNVMFVLTQFADAFHRRNINDLIRLFASDSDVVAIGSDADEKCVGIHEIKALFNRYFENFEALSLELRDTMISTAGQVAWVAADYTITLETGDQETTKYGRLTFVLEKRCDNWLILQIHHSVPS